MSAHVDANGVPYTLAESAETRGRRLYIDGEPFPYATGGGECLKVLRSGELTVLLVPIVVMGPVTITPKPVTAAEEDRFPDFTVAFDSDGHPESVLLNGQWRKLTA